MPLHVPCFKQFEHFYYFRDKQFSTKWTVSQHDDTWIKKKKKKKTLGFKAPTDSHNLDGIGCDYNTASYNYINETEEL